MFYRINENCIACGDCSIACPDGAIDDGYTYNTTGNITSTTDVVRDGAMAERTHSIWQGYQITDACTSCGQCVNVCPVGAIVKE